MAIPANYLPIRVRRGFIFLAQRRAADCLLAALLAISTPSLQDRRTKSADHWPDNLLQSSQPGRAMELSVTTEFFHNAEWGQRQSTAFATYPWRITADWSFYGETPFQPL